MKIKTIYKCSNCGYKSPKWAGKCPDCGEWNTFEESEEPKNNAKIAKTISKQPISRLVDVETGNDLRLKTGITEFDRVMGGGIVKVLGGGQLGGDFALDRDSVGLHQFNEPVELAGSNKGVHRIGKEQ